MTAGAYPLTAVAKLPNVAIASPGEVWSDLRANGIIIPGACIMPVNVGGKPYAKQVVAGDTVADVRQTGIALRQVEIPDVNNGPTALGPNEIINQAIADADYLRRYMSGVLHLTLVEPRADYVPGQIIGWAPGEPRPAGKASGTGAWTNVSGNGTAALNKKANTEIFEVHEPYRTFGSSNEGILTVRFLRSNQ
jgi:hypothetical protein